MVYHICRILVTVDFRHDIVPESLVQTCVIVEAVCHGETMFLHVHGILTLRGHNSDVEAERKSMPFVLLCGLSVIDCRNVVTRPTVIKKIS